MIEKSRLNKFISESGVCSRREADRFIEQGHVMVNGKRAQIGDLVSARDKVLLNGNKIEAKQGTDFVFLAFNKPVGIISTTEIGVKDSIIDYIGYHERIFPIGRLDKESQGLIFLTNNGDIVNKILRAGNKHEKEYLVTVNAPINDEFITNMSNGVPILGETTKKCKVTKESVYSFRIVLVQGLNRQIRRMCEYFNYEVIKLERTRIMNIQLKGIPTGEWRQLELAEMDDILAAIANSSSEAKPTKGVAKASNKPKPTKASAKTTNTKEIKQDRASNPNPKSKDLRKHSNDNNPFGKRNTNSSKSANYSKNKEPRAKRK